MRALSTSAQLQSRPRPNSRSSAAVARQCRGRAPAVVRVFQQQQQHVATTTVTTSSAAQQEEVVTEKEAMSRKYNEQMQKQMGWNNPFEVWGLGLVLQMRGLHLPILHIPPSVVPDPATLLLTRDPPRPVVLATPPIPVPYPPCCSTTLTEACTCTRLCQVWAAASVLPAGAAIASACRPSPVTRGVCAHAGSARVQQQQGQGATAQRPVPPKLPDRRTDRPDHHCDCV